MVFSSLPSYLLHPPNTWNHQQQQQQQVQINNDDNEVHHQQLPTPSTTTTSGRPAPRPPPPEHGLRCPRCQSNNTKFCYFNNYSLSQPRHFCKACRRYWTKGGALRNVPVGGACRRRRNKQNKPPTTALPAGATADPPKAHPLSFITAPPPFTELRNAPQWSIHQPPSLLDVENKSQTSQTSSSYMFSNVDAHIVHGQFENKSQTSQIINSVDNCRWGFGATNTLETLTNHRNGVIVRNDNDNTTTNNNCEGLRQYLGFDGNGGWSYNSSSSADHFL